MIQRSIEAMKLRIHSRIGQPGKVKREHAIEKFANQKCFTHSATTVNSHKLFSFYLLYRIGCRRFDRLKAYRYQGDEQDERSNSRE